jgi:predicted RNase H-like nuclease (RuvC/YqgF family)
MEEASKVTQRMIEGLAQEKADLSQKCTESNITIDMLRSQVSNATQKVRQVFALVHY